MGYKRAVEAVPFHPLVARWFTDTFAAPTLPQQAGWQGDRRRPRYADRRPNRLGENARRFPLGDPSPGRGCSARPLREQVRVVYVSPLKALGNDVEKNLAVPLAGIRALAAAEELELPEIRIAVRSGDTPAHERQLQVRRPPHVLITTPESLYILLTAEKSRQALAEAETVIVDEIHAVAADKRGAHLALSLERFDALARRPLQRIGLSATQKPIEEVARLLVGAGRLDGDGTPRCAIVDAGHRRDLDLSIETTDLELGPIASHELRAAIYQRIVELVACHRTTIVSSTPAGSWSGWPTSSASGSAKARLPHTTAASRARLASRRRRASSQERSPWSSPPPRWSLALTSATSISCVISARRRSIATLLQRVGRSGHFLGAVPKGILFPLTRDELVQCAAAVRAVRQGELDRLWIPGGPPRHPRPADRRQRGRRGGRRRRALRARAARLPVSQPGA